MTRKLLTVILLSTAFCVPGPVCAETLSDSISQAIASHPDIDAGKAGASAASKSVWEQRAGFFPTISANARAGRVHADDDTTRGSTGGDAYSWLGEGSVSLTQPLFAGFSGVNRTLAAQDRRSSAEFELGGKSEDIGLRASRAHLNLMRTHELLDIASSYLAGIQERRDSIDLMVREGATNEAELMQAEEILMAAKTTRLGYQEAYMQAEADYIQAVGAPPASTLDFGDTVWDAQIPATVDEALSIATAANPRLQSTQEMSSAYSRDAMAERGGLMPRFDAEASYTERDQDDDLGGELMNAQAMVKMSWNFSTGGGQLARVARSLDQKNEAEAKYRDMLRNVERDIRQKYNTMQTVDEQFGLYVDREQANRNILENYISQFEAGQQTNLQIISAHAKLFESRAARTDAYYRKLLVRFELLNVMGKLRETFGIQSAAKAAQAG